MKGQIALEFSLMVMLTFVFFGVILVVVAFYVTHFSEERALVDLQEGTAAVREELLLAAAVEDGYQRRFEIPNRLNDYPFTISNTNSSVTFTLADGTPYTRELPLISGTLMQGSNRVRKVNGELLVDQG